MKTNSRRLIKILAGAGAFLIALPAFAEDATPASLGATMQMLIDFMNRYLVGFIFALAFIVFIWGAFQYFILGGANEEKRKEGQQFILWSLIGFFLMLSVWGLVNVLTGTLNLTQANRPCIPQFQAPCNSADHPVPTTP